MTDYTSEEFWKGAPEASTHYQPPRAKGCNPVFWMVKNGVPVEAWAVISGGKLHHISDPRYEEDVFDKIIPRPAPPWSGDGLPPVDTSVLLDDARFPVFDDYQEMIGVPVVVTAAFKSPAGVDMIACALPGGLCGCFRADMARPIKTPDQIAAEEREAAAVELAGILSGHDQHITVRDIEMAKYLYDIGYRRATKGDGQ